MQQDTHHEKFRQLAIDQFHNGIEFEHIEINLSKEGATVGHIEIIIRELKDLHYIRRKKRGFKLVLTGALLLVSGFIITLLLFHSGNSISYAMYGITTAGIIFLLWGMIDLMGW
jgi:hypothetical protein